MKIEKCEYCRDKDPRGVHFGSADPDEQINCVIEYRGGYFTITDSNGDWTSCLLNYCPMCGAKIDLEEQT